MDKMFFRTTNNVFFVVDTETTGLHTEDADAIEISALKVRVAEDGYAIEDTFDTYINPGYPLPPAIVEFNARNNTGVTDELLSLSPSKKDATDRFMEFIGDNRNIVGHNIPFDMGFLNKLLQETGYALMEPDLFDTLAESRGKVKGSHKLCSMFEHTSKRYTNSAVGLKGFHNSLADCYATLDVLDYLVHLEEESE